MYSLEKTRREERSRNGARNPSFSSTLLDEIYRSIDEGERKIGEMKFYSETTTKKQSREEEEMEVVTLHRARLLEKWMERKAREKVGNGGMDRKSHRGIDEQDALFFSSTSSSSDSSSGLLSSSDTESTMYGARSRSRGSCFAPPRPKPVRTTVSEKTPAEKQRRIVSNEAESLIKSKSRALKIYNNLKKVKQPISPGGKLSNFLNSLFTAGHARKSKTTPSSSIEDANAERKEKSGQASTCSSASSFSRSCLSKTSPSSKMRNGVKRTVRFYPVSVIVDEDSRPCGHKSLYDYETEDTRIMGVPVSVPTAWKIGVKKNNEDVMCKSKRVDEAAIEFLKEYHRKQKKSDLSLSKITNEENEDEDEEDDCASCSSSDLFELDHLAVIGNDRYREELPVYETTHVRTNRAIANGFLM